MTRYSVIDPLPQTHCIFLKHEPQQARHMPSSLEIALFRAAFPPSPKGRGMSLLLSLYPSYHKAFPVVFYETLSEQFPSQSCAPFWCTLPLWPCPHTAGLHRGGSADGAVARRADRAVCPAPHGRRSAPHRAVRDDRFGAGGARRGLLPLGGAAGKGSCRRAVGRRLSERRGGGRPRGAAAKRVCEAGRARRRELARPLLGERQ